VVTLNASEQAAKVRIPAPRGGVWTDALDGDSVIAAGARCPQKPRPSGLESWSVASRTPAGSDSDDRRIALGRRDLPPRDQSA
jgi:hypothetical protein